MTQALARSILVLLAGASALLIAFAAAADEKPKAAAEPPADTKAYCKALYGKAYVLCGREDHSCKIIAADKWSACLKTGRWP